MAEAIALLPDVDEDVCHTDTTPDDDEMEDEFALHRYSSQLPSSYRAGLEAEQKLLIRSLYVLVHAILNSDEARTSSQSNQTSPAPASDLSEDNVDPPLVAEGYENEFERDYAALEKGINRYLDLKYPLEPHDFTFFINALLRGALSPSLDMGLRSKLARAVTRLLQKRNCTIPNGIPWRSIMKIIVKYHISCVTGGPFIGRDIRDAHCRNMLTLLTCSRNFLIPGDSAEKIWEEFLPKLSPTTDVDARFQDLLFLSHVLPTRGASWSGWMQKGMEIWQSIESSSDWDTTWMSMMGRLSKHQPCVHDWTPHLPLVYGRLTKSLNLPLGAIAPQSAADRRAPHLCSFLLGAKPISSAAALIVYSLSPKHPETLEYLERLFALIANYFHPSNSGRWSHTIGNFLVHITVNLVIRVVEERRATKAGVLGRVLCDTVQKGVAPMEHRLSEEYSERLVNLLQPLIQHGLHSKVSSMSVQAASSARDLAIIAPHVVIESFLMEASDGLESISSPHRTIAALRLLSTITSVFLDTDFFPNGADYLPQVMMLTLPGIDPNDMAKTESTLKFIAATAGRLQCIIASDPEGSIAFFLEEYVHQFLERVFALLESLEAPPKKNRNGTYPDACPQLSYFIFAVTVENLFGCLPERLAISAAQRISRQINGAACLNAKKYYGVLVRTACAAAAATSHGTSATLFLPMLLDQLLEPVQSPTDETQLQLVSIAENELVWRIRMLAQACRCCGSGVLEYLEKIANVVRLAMDKPTRPLYKAGGRLLRGVLEGLTAVQMKFGPGRGTEADSFADGELYSFEWKEPSAEEWMAAEHFLESFIVSAEELAHEKQGNDHSSKITEDRDALFRVLRMLHAIQRGGRWLLGGVLPDHFKVLDKFLDPRMEMTKSEAKLALKRPVPAGLGGERDSAGSTELAVKLWTRTYTLVSKIVTSVMATRPDDGALLYRCLEPIELAHEPFRRGHKSRQPMHTYRSYKAVYKPIMACKRPFGAKGGVGRSMPRFIVKHRIEAQHELRLSIAARSGLCCSDIFDKLIGVLTDLSVNDFPRVRAEARGVLTRSLRVSPPHIRRREISRVIEVLEKSASGVVASNDSGEEGGQINGVNGTVTSDLDDPMSIDTKTESDPGKSKEGDILYDRMIGAATVLRSSAAAPIIMRDWSLLSMVIKALLDAMLAAVRPDAGNAVGFLFAKLSSLVRPLPLDPIRLVLADFETVPSGSVNPGEETEKARREGVLNTLNRYLLGMLDRTSETLKHEQGKKKEAHWRLQSLVATVLYIVLRADRPPPPDVAEFFINGMASDVVTLRQVSSKAVMFILAVHGRRAGVAHPADKFDDSPASWDALGQAALSVIGRKICTEEFAKSVIHTLALDHDGDSGDGGRSRNAAVGNVGGSIAIMNLSRVMDGDACWMLAGGRPWPSSWIPKSRDSLNLVRMRLYESFLRVYGRHVLDSFLPIVAELIQKLEAKEEMIISGVKDEDVRVLTGEVLAAICRGLDAFHCNDEAIYKRIENLAVSLLSDMSGRLGNVTGGTIIRLIATADTFTIGRRVWKGILNWLLRKKPIIVQMGNGPVAHLQARRLRYLHSALADLDDSKDDALLLFVMETLPALTDKVGFDHELKTVREEVAKCLSLIATFLPAELDNAFEERITLLCDRLAPTVKAAENDAMDMDNVEDERRKSRSRQGETLSRFVSIVQWGGKSLLFEKYIPKVLPALFSSFDESDPERIAHSRMALSLSAQGRFSTSVIDEIISSVEETVKDTRWKVRSSVLAFLQVFSFSSLFSASPASLQHIRDIVVKLLSDSQLEVRQAAAASFVTMIRDAAPKAVGEVREKCLEVLKMTTPKRRGSKRQTLSPETLCKRHGAVLGLSSMITSSPYSVPEWMPSVLVALSGCVNDPSPISTGVRKLFADFMRTHRDEWQTHKLSFSADELEIVSELLVSPSYYA